ncbi:MAG: hypothetical protein J6P07_05885 [Spirochaetaceae bacterium]|nr:hypothetical protein [Spirochaetaceae bacterium]MBO7731532.1 hypothetical protein [Methanobrevibacter sp.]
MVSNIVKLAKIALADVDRAKVVALIDCINLTNQEKEIVIKTELEGLRLYDMADNLSLSLDSISHIKQSAMRKIGVYLTQKLQ